MANPRPNFGHYVKSAHFRRTLLGYHPRDVDAHLDVVSGWFSLAGLDDVLDELVDESREEAERIVREAHEEAAAVRQAAESEARSLVEQARGRAALDGRGRVQVGRPLGRPERRASRSR